MGAAPSIVGKGMLTSPAGEEFIQLNGVDPALESEVIALASAMKTGTIAALGPSADPDALPGILLGSDLAANLGVVVGDRITVFTPEGTLSPMGMVSHQRRLRVAGIFTLGLSEVDGVVCLRVARYRREAARPRHRRIHSAQSSESVGRSGHRRPVRSTFGSEYRTEDWSSMNRSLFSALSLEKIAVSLAISLIVMVAALNIIATLILLVMEKHRDIAILKTMGASAKSVMAIFVAQGLIIGIAGTVTGAAAGLGVSTILDRYHLIRVPADVYQVSYLPFIVLWSDFAFVVLTAVAICLFATIYPSLQASRLDPAQALRYE